MTAIEPGTRVNVRDADGALLPRIAISSVEAGSTFEVVWVCKEDEWDVARAAGRQPEGMAWPAEHVLVADEQVAA
jgi:hypothetical protein